MVQALEYTERPGKQDVICVQEDQMRCGGGAHAGIARSRWAVIGLSNERYSGIADCLDHFNSVVGGAIVHHDDLAERGLNQSRFDGIDDARCIIKYWNDNGEFDGFGRWHHRHDLETNTLIPLPAVVGGWTVATGRRCRYATLPIIDGGHAKLQ